MQSFSSQHLPLGIIEMEAAECEPETYSWQDEGEFLLLCSDGVLEAEVPGGEEFGQAGVLKALAGAGGQDALEALNMALSEHLQGHSAHDDVSFLLLDLA
jgi:serine phosphatase RsbU (regulator of sigma subunit)